MNNIKSLMESFVASLHLYDYILFGVSGALFILILLLAIILRNKTGLSLLLVLLAFVIVITGPLFGYQYIHTTVYKTEISELQIKKLEFSQALVIKGNLRNIGSQSFHTCTISAKAFKGPTNILEEYVNPLKPFQKVSILKKTPIEINDSIDFKMMLEPFTYSNEYNISVKVDCL